MGKNKVKLAICGSDFYITTEDDVDYAASLGDELDQKITKIVKENERVSMTQASVLVALDYADAFKKAEASADNLRAQIRDYLEDSARARMEVEVARREIERLNREMQSLRAKLADAGKK